MISTCTRRAVAVFAALALSSSASAAPHALWINRPRTSSPFLAEAVNDVLYYGGPVISNAKVYAVFWGPNVDAQTQSQVGPFFSNILGSTYMDWLSEYATNVKAVDGRPGTNQTIGRGTFAGSVTITPANASTNLTDAMIQSELDAQIAAGKLAKPDANSLYMIFFPAGVSISLGSGSTGGGSCSDFCAYHEGFKSPRDGSSIYYGVMPTCGGVGCGAGFDGLSSTTSHELIEAVTDPFPTDGSNPSYPQAWNDNQGNEVADLCVGGSSTVTGSGLTSTVQWIWSNTLGACNQGPWTHGPAAAVASAVAGLPARPFVAPLLEKLSASPADAFGR
ncbi:MAG: hypothetical protein HKL90_00930 [Elusimicrobia bacterium]|nr:hypothetical protein [Elusimicrobiota bacterium]